MSISNLTIRTSISLDKSVHELALEDSKLLLGRENLSGYVSYLVTKAHNRKIEKGSDSIK